MTPPRKRLDLLLVERGLAPSRTAAQGLIRAGQVTLTDHDPPTRPTKPSITVPENVILRVLASPAYVSRAGEKLAAALDAFPQIDPEVKHFLDVGASTGGFTDCLLQRGARQAVCVDVGHGQLHSKLRADPRVINLEGLNARHLTAEQLPYPDYSLIVADLSFISLTKVLPAVWSLLRASGFLIALVKPQFESDPKIVAQGKGIIYAEADRQQALEAVSTFVARNLTGAKLLGTLPSPIEGGDGNREFLAAWQCYSPREMSSSGLSTAKS
ncbi:MAG: TlyA family RNA methyltransferase [Opitutales bacterium]